MAAKKKIQRRRRSSAAVKPRRRTRRKGMSEGLADSFDVSNPASPVRQAAMGAAGGAVAYFIDKNVTDPKTKRLYQLLVTLGAILLKQPAVAAGSAGVMVYGILQDSAVNVGTADPEMVEFFNPAALADDEPMVLDSAGNVLALADGTPVYSSSHDDSIYPAGYPSV